MGVKVFVRVSTHASTTSTTACEKSRHIYTVVIRTQKNKPTKHTKNMRWTRNQTVSTFLQMNVGTARAGFVLSNVDGQLKREHPKEEQTNSEIQSLLLCVGFENSERLRNCYTQSKISASKWPQSAAKLRGTCCEFL